jgi:hypothetical protein
MELLASEDWYKSNVEVCAGTLLAGLASDAMFAEANSGWLWAGS